MFQKKTSKYIKYKNYISNKLINIFKMISYKQKIFSYPLENMCSMSYQNKLPDIGNKPTKTKNLLNI